MTDLWPHKFALPFVGAIIERFENDAKQLLIQTRHNPARDPRFTGTIEFPAGILDHKFESIYDALEREIHEETGLSLKEIKNQQRYEPVSTGRHDLSYGFQPFFCSQQLEGDYPWIGFIFLCEVEEGEVRAQKGETKDPRWIDYDDMKRIVQFQPERIFGLQLPAWHYYFGVNK